MKIRLDYPDLRTYEHVEAKRLDSGLCQLTTHALFVPLAPGDVLRVLTPMLPDHPVAVGIATLVEIYTYDVDFRLPINLVTGQALPDDDPSQVKLRETIELWQREAWATQHTGISAYVSAPEQKWLEDRVVLNPYVDHVQMVRWPGMEIDFEVAVRNADLGDLTRGPWA